MLIDLSGRLMICQSYSMHFSCSLQTAVILYTTREWCAHNKTWYERNWKPVLPQFRYSRGDSLCYVPADVCLWNFARFRNERRLCSRNEILNTSLWREMTVARKIVAGKIVDCVIKMEQSDWLIQKNVNNIEDHDR